MRWSLRCRSRQPARSRHEQTSRPVCRQRRQGHGPGQHDRRPGAGADAARIQRGGDLRRARRHQPAAVRSDLRRRRPHRARAGARRALGHLHGRRLCAPLPSPGLLRMPQRRRRALFRARCRRSQRLVDSRGPVHLGHLAGRRRQGDDHRDAASHAVRADHQALLGGQLGRQGAGDRAPGLAHRHHRPAGRGAPGPAHRDHDAIGSRSGPPACTPRPNAAPIRPTAPAAAPRRWRNWRRTCWPPSGR